MSGVYYAAVEGDPLTTGGRTFASGKVGTIEDESGRPRRMVFIGDEAHCDKCNSTGAITYGASVSEGRRMVDLANGGRRQAVGGDMVLCKCADPPRVIAVHGIKWRIFDQTETAVTPSRASVRSTLQHATYDEQYTLIGADGRPLAGVRYRVHSGPSVVTSGITDSSGKTQRIATIGSKTLRLEIAH